MAFFIDNISYVQDSLFKDDQILFIEELYSEYDLSENNNIFLDTYYKFDNLDEGTYLNFFFKFKGFDFDLSNNIKTIIFCSKKDSSISITFKKLGDNEFDIYSGDGSAIPYQMLRDVLNYTKVIPVEGIDHEIDGNMILRTNETKAYKIEYKIAMETLDAELMLQTFSDKGSNIKIKFHATYPVKIKF